MKTGPVLWLSTLRHSTTKDSHTGAPRPGWEVRSYYPKPAVFSTKDPARLDVTSYTDSSLSIQCITALSIFTIGISFFLFLQQGSISHPSLARTVGPRTILFRSIWESWGGGLKTIIFCPSQLLSQEQRQRVSREEAKEHLRYWSSWSWRIWSLSVDKVS